jgi:hypothetical protein
MPQEDGMTQRTSDAHDDRENPLGIAREPMDPAAAEPIPEGNDPATVRRRRARAGLDGHDDRPRPGMGDLNVDPDGAAGVDMGYGGEGTDIKPSR